MTISGTNIVVDTTDPANVGGPYSITLTVTLADYPMVTALTKTFSVTITCAVQTVTFSTPPPAVTNLVVDVDTQPMDIPFAIS